MGSYPTGGVLPEQRNISLHSHAPSRGNFDRSHREVITSLSRDVTFDFDHRANNSELSSSPDFPRTSRMSSADSKSSAPSPGRRAFMQKRLNREQQLLKRDCPPGLRLLDDEEAMEATRRASELSPASAPAARGDVWVIELEGAKGTLYEGEKFLVKFTFSDSYPIESPEVVFLPPSIPVHPHIYSNGDICLSILYDEWSPALGVQTTAISLLSTLSAAKQKCRPLDDPLYIQGILHEQRGSRLLNAPNSSNPNQQSDEVSRRSSPKLVKWNFHDDKI